MVTISGRIAQPFVDLNAIEKTAQIVLDEENKSGWELSVYLTDDGEIRILNQTYRKVDESTDVLAFSMQEGLQLEGRSGDTKRRVLGDVVISLEAAQRQARNFKRSLKTELNHLLIHGILHLLGYDHRGKSDSNLMKMREKEIFEKIGNRGVAQSG